jgi:3-phenylpropionate/trans-cinnamate dioxygenase ferredoxin subunit
MEKRIKVALVSDIPEGEVVPVEVEGFKLAIVHVDGQFYALEDECSHMECSLSEGLVDDREIVCPCHGARFDLATGEPVTLPAEDPVKCYETIIEEGVIYIRL